MINKGKFRKENSERLLFSNEITSCCMLEQKLHKSELSKQLEIPNSTFSEIMNGKKKINLQYPKSFIKNLCTCSCYLCFPN
ncbi:MAG: hypothetical protein AVDCRST_MAG96-1085 [uncultured Segetibacter sp.]|uniref:Uncharacterized protein n=1 Tax=uncultured Segetibacter sp. TaxID=481133 RepID=A0A6J4RV63_9BACT|nr:MAG: hypothetical protein AVDCRST_MAG96-1085 [uncultured Segetibacter sp.]